MIGWGLLTVAAYAFLAGMLTGNRWVLIGGLGGIVLVYAVAFLIDRFWSVDRWLAKHADPQVEGEGQGDWLLIDVSQIDWSQWPDYRDQERAA